MIGIEKFYIRRYQIILSLFFLVVHFADAQLPADSIAILERQFTSWSVGTPGGVLQISREGETIYHQAFGSAELEHGIPNQLDTRFEAGSVSKQFTAAAVLLLITENRLSLEDDIRQYIPEFPDYGHPVTVHQLLTHTTGIRDWGTVVLMGGWPRTSRVYTQQHVYDIIFRQQNLNFVPGTDFAYSNSNHNLMVLLVERVAKQSFVAFTQERLFDPVGMKDTQWRTDFRQVVSDRAVAYRASGEGWEQFMPFEDTYGHAALLTTTADLIRWNTWLTERKWGDRFETLRLMPYIFENGTKTEYTCGALFVRDVNGQEEICHTGSTAGYRSWLAYYPELKLSVAYLSNDASVPSISVARKVSDIFIGAHALTLPVKNNPSSISSTDPPRQAGIYKRAGGPQVLEWVWQGDSLYLKRDPEWNGMYNDPWKTGIRKFRFMGNSTVVKTPTGEQEFVKVQKIELAKLPVNEIIGKYVSEEAGGRVDVSWDEAQGILNLNFENGHSVEMVQAFRSGEEISLITENHIILTLMYGDNKELTGFRADLSQESFGMARADGLIFTRK